MSCPVKKTPSSAQAVAGDLNDLSWPQLKRAFAFGGLTNTDLGSNVLLYGIALAYFFYIVVGLDKDGMAKSGCKVVNLPPKKF